jgi:hypothetical protein
MADYGFNTQLTPNMPQTSLSDMMNLARNAQAYQQAGQMNPLLLQQQQLQLEQAKQLNPLAVRQQAAATSLAEQTLNPKVEEAIATSSSAVTAAQKAKREKAMSYANDAVKQLQTMVQKPDLTSDDIRSFITDQVKALNGPPEAITQALYGLPENGTPTQLRAFAAKKLATTLDAQAAIEKMYPGATMTAEGATITPRQMGNPLLTGAPAGTPAGPSIATTLSPESRKSVTQIDPVSGDTIIYDVNAQGQPANVRYLKSQPKSLNIPQAVAPGATAETMQAGPKIAIKAVVDANTLMNDASQPGHIPTQINITKTLLNKLKDPKLDTGPIENFLAGKTAGESLTPDQQEVAKLLQQRIQNLSPRTDADAESKRQAYGSMSMKKPALIDLVRRDIGNLTNQEMLHSGNLNAAGDMTNPNLPAVNNYQQKFTAFSKDPVLMQYMGIVGKGQKVRVDDQDKAALAKLISENKLSPTQVQEMEARRKLLVQMSGNK